MMKPLKGKRMTKIFIDTGKVADLTLDLDKQTNEFYSAFNSYVKRSKMISWEGIDAEAYAEIIKSQEPDIKNIYQDMQDFNKAIRELALSIDQVNNRVRSQSGSR